MRKVRIEAVARDDLDQIFEHIAQDNPTAALRVVDRIDAAVLGLADFSTGRPGRSLGTFEKVVSGLPYLIIYEIETIDGEDTVIVLFVQHGARDFPPKR